MRYKVSAVIEVFFSPFFLGVEAWLVGEVVARARGVDAVREGVFVDSMRFVDGG